MSQSELASLSGVTRAAVSAIEAGAQGVSMETLCRIALALGVGPGELLPTREELEGIEGEANSVDRRPARRIADDYLEEHA